MIMSLINDNVSETDSEGTQEVHHHTTTTPPYPTPRHNTATHHPTLAHTTPDGDGLATRPRKK